MTYDIHAHLLGLDPDDQSCFVRLDGRRRILRKLLMRKFGLNAGHLAEGRANEIILQRTLDWISSSELDRVVLLAFDRVYRPGGAPGHDQTVMFVSNEYAAEAAGRNAKALFGASVHPYREDALEELERARQNGAVLVKWLPSTQGIALDDPACFPFYEKLAATGMPLLCHLGNEHTLSTFSNALNRPALLEHALDRGVTVIGAHLGARLMLHERSYFREWAELAYRHENLYGDISAFCSPLRAATLSRAKADERLRGRLLFGSDFPAFTLPGCYLFQLGLKRVSQLKREANPFNKAYRTMKEAGVPGEVFTRAGDLLRPHAPRETTEKGMSNGR